MIFLDGCAVLWVIPWPKPGTVQDYLDRFRQHLSGYLHKGPVYPIFDRYVCSACKHNCYYHHDLHACISFVVV